MLGKLPEAVGFIEVIRGRAVSSVRANCRPRRFAGALKRWLAESRRNPAYL
jgi:hypothetical protein